MNKFFHWLTGCSGWTDHMKDKDGVWWIVFKCSTCGKVKFITKSKVQDS